MATPRGNSPGADGSGKLVGCNLAGLAAEDFAAGRAGELGVASGPEPGDDGGTDIGRLRL